MKYNALKDGRATLQRVLKLDFWLNIHFISSFRQMRINLHVALQRGRKWEVMTVIRDAPCAPPELLQHTPPLSEVIMVEAHGKWS